MTRLDDEAIAKGLAELEHWTREEDFIVREFVFNDFVTAFGWMTSVALAAEAMNHHPNWSNVYSSVQVRLSTHDAGGITHKDFELAKRMDQLAS